MNRLLRCLALWSITWTTTKSLQMHCENLTCTVVSVSLENFVQTVNLYNAESFDPLATTLIFRIENMQTIPIEFMNDFTQLETVRASNNDIYILHSTVFGENHRDSFKDLKNLYLDHNDITSLQNSTFAGAEKLRVLQLSFNNIFTIEAHAFKGLDRLEFLDLSHNWLQQLDWTIFEATGGLEYLNLEDNPIQHHEMIELRNLSHFYIDYFEDLVGSKVHILDSLPKLVGMGIRDHTFSCNQLTDFLDLTDGRGIIVKDGSSEDSLQISRCLVNLYTLEQFTKYFVILVLVIIAITVMALRHYRRRRAVDSPVKSKVTDQKERKNDV